MKYTKIILGAIVSLTMVAVVSICATLWWNNRGTITIENHTGEHLEDIHLVYHQYNAIQKVWIGRLPAKQKYQHHINYANIYEGRIIMNYLDADKKYQTKTVAGYVAEYDKQHYVVKIK